MNYPRYKLGDLLKVSGGYAFKSEDFRDDGYLVVRISNIQNGQVSLDESARIPSSKLGQGERYPVKSGDILIAMSGATTGKIGVVPYDFERPAFQNQRVGNFLIQHKNRLDKFYLRHFLDSQEFQSQVQNSMWGAAQPNISGKQLESFLIPLPPLAEQQRIATILDQADALRTKRRAALAKLDTLLQATFLDFMERMNDLCVSVQLNDLAQKGRGTFVNGPFGSDLLTTELIDYGVPVIYIRDIRNGEYQRISTAYVTAEKAEQLAVCAVYPNDLLIAKVGDPPGISAVYPENEPSAIVTQDVIRIRLNPALCDEVFLSYYLNSSIGKHQIKLITVEATRSRFSLTDLKRLEVQIPPIEKQKEFSRIAKSIERNRQSHRRNLEENNNLFHSLQQRAFKGEL